MGNVIMWLLIGLLIGLTECATAGWMTEAVLDKGGQLTGYSLRCESSAGAEGPSLLVTCTNRGVTVSIDWNVFLVGRRTSFGEKVALTYRIGEGPALRAEWPLQSDGETIDAPGEISTQLLAALTEATELTVQIAQPGMGAIRALFDLNGLQEAISDADGFCAVNHQ